MTLIALQATSNLLVHLLNPAVRASVLAGAVGLGLAAFRVKAPAVRLFIWSGVLYAAIAMPLLGPLLPPLSIPTPAFVQFAVSHYLTAGSIPEDAAEMLRATWNMRGDDVASYARGAVPPIAIASSEPRRHCPVLVLEAASVAPTAASRCRRDR